MPVVSEKSARESVRAASIDLTDAPCDNALDARAHDRNCTDDRRERRRQRTVEAIRRAALELVVEHGLDQVSVAMIAERADIGYRTFFNHFSSKEEALIGPDPVVITRVVEAFEARPADEPPLVALIAALKSEFRDFEGKRADICTRLSMLEANPELLPRFHAQYTAMEDQIAEAIARRTGTDAERDLYPHLLAAVASTALRTCSVRWSAAGSTGSPADWLDEAFASIGNGMPAPDKRARR